MKNFIPDYNNILDAANNKKPSRTPIYEHIISDEIIEKIMNTKISDKSDDVDEYLNIYCSFFKKMTYDTVSFECLATEAMPGSGALYHHKEGAIKTYDDFKKYPWDEVKEIFFKENDKYYKALKKHIPEGMAAIGGIGNGVFECVQDIVGYTNLCYIKIDDPKLYRAIFNKVGQMLYDIWEEFLRKYSDSFCVMRFGDDLGYKMTTLLPPEDVRKYIIPQYKKIISLIHSHNKPFLLHSCGNIFEIMDDLIEAGINAKHSNEDEIAKMDKWYEMYGDKIGNFGGIDADILCRMSTGEIDSYVKRIYNLAQKYKGTALGSGNSIPEYVPVDNYVTMIESINKCRL